jgi:hypothetical protein
LRTVVDYHQRLVKTGGVMAKDTISGYFRKLFEEKPAGWRLWRSGSMVAWTWTARAWPAWLGTAN